MNSINFFNYEKKQILMYSVYVKMAFMLCLNKSILYVLNRNVSSESIEKYTCVIHTSLDIISTFKW